ncbi:tetratricopeptide repeat-containing sensor histidine kinase [Sediminicola luteus]|uniref:Signal transduction histidine kinase internal region domain-containing protein n=1 Tax=Sediminicola luteus TaxID=319238 RepID=A0A2A4G7V6_9FLAO|nr:tetratricopeptide repeat protein [Sediminicola luteus]PCE63832.1 hypothetical protein B7P33_11215 [Sediminicola luteus]
MFISRSYVFLLGFLSLFVSNTIWAQQTQTVDSTVILSVREQVIAISDIWYKDVTLAQQKADSLLAYVQKHKFDKGMAQAYSAYGSLYQIKGDYGSAIAYLQKSLKYSEKIGHKLFLAYTQLNIGGTLFANGNYQEAKTYFLKALPYFRENQKPKDIFQCLNGLGMINARLNAPRDSVHLFFDEALSIAEKDLGNTKKARSLNGKAFDDIRRGYRLPRAKGWLEQSLILLEDSEEAHSILNRSFTLVNLAEVELALGNGQQALEYITEAERLYTQTNNGFSAEIKECYETRVKILEYLGRFKESSLAYKKLVKVNAKLHAQKEQWQLNRSRVEMETEEREREIQNLTQKAEIQELRLRQQRLGFMVLGFLVVLVLLIVGFLYLRYKQKQRQALVELKLSKTKEKLRMEQDLRQSELKAIRSQLKPHFIYNALNSIQEYILTNEKTIAGRYIGKFAMLMRIFLNHSQLKTVLIDEEMEALDLYLILEKLRLGDSFRYEIEKDYKVSGSFEIPSLLLQPYVENAIKHGLMHKSGDKYLSVHIDKKENGVVCVVEDNGIGRKQSMTNNQRRNAIHRSFATQATQKRLELINADSDQLIQEEIIDLYDGENRAQGTRVVITITDAA